LGLVLVFAGGGGRGGDGGCHCCFGECSLVSHCHTDCLFGELVEKFREDE
jgi:hypothetical protein